MTHRNWDIDCKVYIGGLRDDANRYDIEDVFRKIGKVKDVWVARKPPGFAFVEMEDPRDAQDAVRELDGTRMCGARVKVEMSNGGKGDGGRGGGRDRRGGGRDDRRNGGGRDDRRGGGRRERTRSRSRDRRRRSPSYRSMSRGREESGDDRRGRGRDRSESGGGRASRGDEGSKSRSRS